MTTKLIENADLTEFIRHHLMCVVYFSGPDCRVCMALKPKLFELLESRFEQIAIAEVDCAVSPVLAAQQTVFTVPTLILYIEGREKIRKLRAFSLAELVRDIDRPYSMLFE